MLRMATPADEDRIFDLLVNFYNNTEYKTEAMDEGKVRNLIRMCSDPTIRDSVVILWDKDGIVSGLIAGQWTEVRFNNSRVATEIVWWVEPYARKTEAANRLLGAFEAWAEHENCQRVQMYALNNNYASVLHRYYYKEGYKLAELSYVRDLN